MSSADKLMKKINEDNLKPVLKNSFQSMSWLTFLLLFLSTVLGSVAFSIILFAIQQVDFQPLEHIAHSTIEFALAIIPSVWILTLIIALLMSIFSIRYSKKGYKFTLAGKILYSALFSILLGTFIFLYGGAESFERIFALKVERYESVLEKKKSLWSLPEQGFIGGKILSVETDILMLESFDKKTWIVNYKNAFISRIVLLERGEQIKIVGKLTADGHFEAEEIKPWGGPSGRPKGRMNQFE